MLALHRGTYQAPTTSGMAYAGIWLNRAILRGPKSLQLQHLIAPVPLLKHQGSLALCVFVTSFEKQRISAKGQLKSACGAAAFSSEHSADSHVLKHGQDPPSMLQSCNLAIVYHLAMTYMCIYIYTSIYIYPYPYTYTLPYVYIHIQYADVQPTQVSSLHQGQSRRSMHDSNASAGFCELREAQLNTGKNMDTRRRLQR